MKTFRTILVLTLVLSPLAVFGQDTAGKEPTQGFASGLSIGSGATLLVNREKTTVTVGLTSQTTKKLLNFWNIGLSGTIGENDAPGTIYSSSDADAPGLKLKLGTGFSSFQAADRTRYREAATIFLGEAWCLDVLAEVNELLPTPAPLSVGGRCGDFFRAVSANHAAGPPADAEKAKMAAAVLKEIETIAASPASGKSAACKALKAHDNVFKHCLESGKPQPTAEEQRKHYPALYDRLVAEHAPSGFYYRVAANYQPSLVSTAYRAKKEDETFDLETAEYWTRWLHGATLDGTVYYRRLVIGAQLGYGETVNIKPVDVCRMTESGSFRAEQCKKAMLGRPSPDASYSAAIAIALDPLVLPGATALTRPGALLNIRLEVPRREEGRTLTVSLPVYLAPVAAPASLVIGVQPTWTDKTGPEPERKFAVLLFLSARPRAQMQ